jgi:hypothetical protein
MDYDLIRDQMQEDRFNAVLDAQEAYQATQMGQYEYDQDEIIDPEEDA